MSKKSRTARSGARAASKKASASKAPATRTVKKHVGAKHTAKGPARKKAASRASAKQGTTKAAKAKGSVKRANKADRSKAAASSPSALRDRNAAVRQLAAHLRFCHATTEKLMDSTPDEHALAQLPGADNHKAWTLGHHAISQAWFASMLTGSMPSVPESYNALFGMNSVPQPDASLYPPLQELKSYWKSTFDALIEAVDALTDDELPMAPAQDSGGFITSKFDAIAKAAWHDGWHAGQLAALRRGLGLPPALG